MFLLFQSMVFDEIDLTNLSVAERSTKNINHSFQVSSSTSSISGVSLVNFYVKKGSTKNINHSFQVSSSTSSISGVSLVNFSVKKGSKGIINWTWNSWKMVDIYKVNNFIAWGPLQYLHWLN